MDLELERLNKQKDNLEELKVIDKMRNVVKEAQGKSIKMENDAKSLLDEYNQLKAKYEKQHKEIQRLTNLDVNSMDKSQIYDTLTKINSISSEIFMIERNLNIIINKIGRALKDFETNKNQAVMARNKHKEAKDQYSAKVAQIEPKIAKLQEELKAKEKELDQTLFAKYKTMKNDGIFPVFAKLTNDACGYCRIEVPKNKLDNLKGNNTIICEHCRRIIYR